MLKKLLCCCFVFLVQISFANSFADSIIKDSGLEVSKSEFEHAVKYWPKKERENAALNDGDRYNMLSRFMVAKKINEEMKKVTLESDPELYWQREFAIRNIQNKLYINHFKENIKVPDMTKLAKQRLLVNREKYAASPEERKASHILVICAAGKCDRKLKRPEAEKVLAELKAGASFEAMVEKYSDDPRSKSRKGVLPNWLRLGQTRMDPYFVEGVFDLKKVGDYSTLVETQFGFHIIRLDNLKEKSFKPDAEVLPAIKETLQNKYRNLAIAAFTNKLALSPDATIDAKAIEEVLAEYKPKADNTEKPKGIVIKQFIRK